MKKLFTLSVCLLTASIGFSQNAPIDFETGGKGATWTWKTFENVTDPVLEIIDNPDSKAPNTSSKVAKFTALQGGNPWAGCESQKTVDIGTFTLSASNAIVKIMVWKSTISDVGIKFVKNDNSAIPEIKVPNTKTNQWEELTFDFTSKIGTLESKDITQIVIFPDFIPGGPGARTATTISYFDNITFSGGTTLAEPTVAAKAPTKLAADVISLYSDAYNDVTVDTWRTSWSVASLADVKIGTDSVKKYAGLDYVGIETIAKQIDITTMDSFEFDLWTPNSTKFRFKLVDAGANGTVDGQGKLDDKEHELNVTPTLNGWNHIAVPISNFTGLTTKKNIAQLIFSSDPAGTSVAYIDNILFSKKAKVGINSAKQESVGIYPNPATSLLNINTTKAIENVFIYNSLGQIVITSSPNANSVAIDIANLPIGFYTVKASINGVETFSKFIKE